MISLTKTMLMIIVRRTLVLTKTIVIFVNFHVEYMVCFKASVIAMRHKLTVIRKELAVSQVLVAWSLDRRVIPQMRTEDDDADLNCDTINSCIYVLHI